MKHASALIFPDTEPESHIIAKLLIFFDSLAYYLPTEPETAENKGVAFFANLCSPYVPEPLAEDELFRFNRLLREMETGRPEELSRLFSAATVPLTTGQARDLDETSAAGVYSSLQKDAAAKTSIRNKERLWQARLILKLAEMFDRRETEVRRGLARISSSEQKLLAALGGYNNTESEDLAETIGLDKPKYSSTENIPSPEPSFGTSGLHTSLRLKAWAELYLADSSEQQPTVLATANPDCGAILLDGYENLRHQDPVKLFSLPVPALHFTNSEKAGAAYLADRNSFREASLENIENLARYLHETACPGEAGTNNRRRHPGLAENLSTWEKNLQRYFPAPAKTGKLDFYCIPGISLAGLLQHLFRLKAPVQETSRTQPSDILAVLVS